MAAASSTCQKHIHPKGFALPRPHGLPRQRHRLPTQGAAEMARATGGHRSLRALEVPGQVWVQGLSFSFLGDLVGFNGIIQEYRI